MKVHVFEQSQVLPVTLPEAWAFFSTPENLDAITPPDLAFRTQSGGDEEMFRGQVIVHRIRIAPGCWSTWVTEITEMEQEDYFVDQQRFGPYRFWHHLHRFRECPGGVDMLDRVHYALPFPPFGELGGGLIRRQLDGIFRFRRAKLAEVFGDPPDGAPGPE